MTYHALLSGFSEAIWPVPPLFSLVSTNREANLLSLAVNHSYCVQIEESFFATEQLCYSSLDSKGYHKLRQPIKQHGK